MTQDAVLSAPARLTVRAGINERQFMESLKHLFAGKFATCGELMQNARRAGATGVDFTIDVAAKRLTVVDDGCGVQDFAALVELCTSKWDERTTLTDRPFGMGLFSLFFTGEHVRISSQGHALELTLDDIIAKREINVQPDPGAPLQGTRIVVDRLKDELLVGSTRIALRAQQGQFGEVGNLALVEAIATRAQGFSIPVRINGIECPRPAAQSALTGEHTSIGFVSIPGIHRPGALPRGAMGVTLFLQGLPIGAVRDEVSPSATIVHLANDSFIAKMPDRAYLYDHDASMRRINANLHAQVCEYLARRKAELPGDEFIIRHWEDCSAYDCLELTSDIPWVPLNELESVEVVSDNHEQVYAPRWIRVSSEEERLAKRIEFLVSREDVVSGRIKVWRDTPHSASEDADAAALLKVMQREKIHGCRSRLVDGHWLLALAPSTIDMQVGVRAINPGPSTTYEPYSWCEQVTIQLVESVQVSVTSTIDPQFRLDVEVRDDWILTAAPQESGDEVSDPPRGEARCLCLVAGDGGREHPVLALSDYCDENDDYREEWREHAEETWDALVSAIRGESLSKVIGSALYSASPRLSPPHAGHLVLIRAAARERRDYGSDSPQLQVLDLQDERFWQALSARIEAMDASLPLALRLRESLMCVDGEGFVN
jgi:hypothetical protein